MKKEFIIHIGLNKTGTTSLQAMMHHNSQLLLEHGIYYPTINSNHGRFLRSMFMNDPRKQPANIRSGLRSKKQVAQLNDKFKKKLETHIQNPLVKKVIFSGEVLATLAEKEISRLFQWVSLYASKITILCCTRNPIDWYNSQVQQSLKVRAADIITKCNDICANSFNTVDKRIKNYISCFGRENVVVYDFDKHKHRLYEKFLELCRLNQAVIELLLQQTSTHNESLSQEASLFLDKLNKINPLPADADLSKSEHHLIKNITGQKFKLPKDLLTKILLSKENSFKWLAENYPSECADYINWPKKLEKYESDSELFNQKTIDSIVLLIHKLAYEEVSTQRG